MMMKDSRSKDDQKAPAGLAGFERCMYLAAMIAAGIESVDQLVSDCLYSAFAGKGFTSGAARALAPCEDYASMLQRAVQEARARGADTVFTEGASIAANVCRPFGQWLGQCALQEREPSFSQGVLWLRAQLSLLVHLFDDDVPAGCRGRLQPYLASFTVRGTGGVGALCDDIAAALSAAPGNVQTSDRRQFSHFWVQRDAGSILPAAPGGAMCEARVQLLVWHHRMGHALDQAHVYLRSVLRGRDIPVIDDYGPTDLVRTGRLPQQSQRNAAGTPMRA